MFMFSPPYAEITSKRVIRIRMGQLNIGEKCLKAGKEC